MTKTIAFYLQDGVEVLDFAGPMEVFAYAGYKVFTVSETKEPIKSQGILTVTPDYSIEDAPAADILAFFGGNSNAASQNSKVIEWVKGQSEVQYHFSVCTGAFVLAEAGILDGKTATTFHSALDNLESNYPKINVRKDTRFVDNGRVITTAGVSAGIDGALHLVAKLQGINAAKRTAYYMEYDNWKIGDGLLLTDDNPYLPKESPDFYKAFEGRYEYKDNQQLELAFVNGDLHALINGVHYPIYHEEGPIFSDVDGKRIFFKREGSKQVLGYSLTKEGVFYKKL
ncbi:DJ-1/PfpI family protein [Flagellimonas sp. 2504JD4-2]